MLVCITSSSGTFCVREVWWLQWAPMLMGITVTQLCPPQHYGVPCLFFFTSSAPQWHNFSVQMMQHARLKVGSWSSLTNSFPRRWVKWQPYLMPPAQHLCRLQQLRNLVLVIPAPMMMGTGEDDGMDRPDRHLQFCLKCTLSTRAVVGVTTCLYHC